ncbi:class I SAM-dependent methyltransferase [Lactobacillus sp. ESL0731]|uniref:tRNA (adenine(22)-N(1))-methyltransferase n=1 Tax=unclassified Lactobacillus TaxID=2620435 RepID=UPI0023F967D7|nr:MULTISPECIES: class I SAM-dependent methyltransferase [unclassified Lactobacillus]WEV50324.1 class I SAM-dependent methyltransferase [Lactobacillus sp. ESL0700]WEV61453.1 class I SAM-dependent methyltransferase [Lactobacillus sp. ESL0731]
MNLRLNTLAQMIDQGARVADIGTDHAYLPIALVQSGKIDFAIASDIAQGPLANAQENIAQAGLEQQIDVRLGAGLETITHEDRIDTVVIAGMGGKLMTEILDTAWQNDFQFPTLVLEPNVGEPGVRKWLVDHSYQIEAEDLIAEAGHTYELIKAVHVSAPVKLTDAEIFFGPLILKAKNPVFYQKWRGQLAYHQNLLVNLNKAKNKDTEHIEQIEHEITMIKEELDDQS